MSKSIIETLIFLPNLDRNQRPLRIHEVSVHDNFHSYRTFQIAFWRLYVFLKLSNGPIGPQHV